MIKRNVVIGIIALPLQLSAAPQPSNPVFSWMMDNIVFILAGMVIVGALTVIYKTLLTILNHTLSANSSDKGLNADSTPKEHNLFKKWMSNLSGLIPLEREHEIDTHHNYDGIRELDNKLPPWWLYLFYFTIVWAGVYLYIYEFSDIGQSSEEEYLEQMEYAHEQRINYLYKVANSVNETNVTLVEDAERLETGKKIFMSQCVACHGAFGEGGIGPNFSDEYWIHGGDIKDLFATIKYGVPEKGMISWKSQLSPSSIQNVASYILTLQGTDPPNQKKPEGKLYQPES